MAEQLDRLPADEELEAALALMVEDDRRLLRESGDCTLFPLRLIGFAPVMLSDRQRIGVFCQDAGRGVRRIGVLPENRAYQGVVEVRNYRVRDFWMHGSQLAVVFE